MSSGVNRAGAPFRPTQVFWSATRGIAFRFDKVDALAAVAAGLLRFDELPGERDKCAFNGEHFSVHRCRDGSISMTIGADHVLARNVAFKRFLGCLLADTRLSLMKHERDQ